MADDQIAVLFERTMYHMTFGTVEAVQGKEEYIITLPAELPKVQLQETITVVMQSLAALAADHNDSAFRPNDTWTVRLVPLRFPMMAYPTKEPDADGIEPPPVSEEEAASAKKFFTDVPDAGAVKIAEYTTAGALAQMAEIFRVYASDQIGSKRFQSTQRGKRDNDLRAEIWTQAATELDEAAVNISA